MFIDKIFENGPVLLFFLYKIAIMTDQSCLISFTSMYNANVPVSFYSTCMYMFCFDNTTSRRVFL